MAANKTPTSFVIMSFGWDTNYAVPSSKVSALLEILEACEMVQEKYLKSADRSVWFVAKNPRKVRMDLTAAVLPEEPFDPEVPELKEVA
jgi:hypothetical protein